MAKTQKKPCDKGANQCLLQFGESCLAFPGFAEDMYNGNVVRCWRQRDLVSYHECMEKEYPVMGQRDWSPIGKRVGLYIDNPDRINRIGVILSKVDKANVDVSGSQAKPQVKSQAKTRVKKADKVAQAAGTDLFDALPPEPVINKKGQVVGETPPLF